MKIEIHCENCDKPFMKYARQIASTNHNFCTKRCSCIFFNKRMPKRKAKIYTCVKCNGGFAIRGEHYSKKYCPKCSADRKLKAKFITLGELYNRLKHLQGKHRSWLNAVVRQYNREWNKDMLKLPCAACSYSIHVELAHIKGITSFTLTAKLGEVNARENNIQLCRNCHWELDNGLISISALVPALSPKQVTVNGRCEFESHREHHNQ